MSEEVLDGDDPEVSRRDQEDPQDEQDAEACLPLRQRQTGEREHKAAYEDVPAVGDEEVLDRTALPLGTNAFRGPVM